MQTVGQNQTVVTVENLCTLGGNRGPTPSLDKNKNTLSMANLPHTSIH